MEGRVVRRHGVLVDAALEDLGGVFVAFRQQQAQPPSLIQILGVFPADLERQVEELVGEIEPLVFQRQQRQRSRAP